MDSKIQKYLSKIGKRGGESISDKKVAAGKLNIQKAIEARRKKFLDKNWGDLDTQVKQGSGH